MIDEQGIDKSIEMVKEKLRQFQEKPLTLLHHEKEIANSKYLLRTLENMKAKK